ncbi:MAG: hypothetical protein ACJ72D_16615 [Marmoricola sp.]
MSFVEVSMEWIRRRPRVAAGAGIVGVIVVLVLVSLLVRSPKAPADEPSLGLPSSTPTGPLLPELSTTPTPATIPTTQAQSDAAIKAALGKVGAGLPGTKGLQSGSLSAPGLQGGSVYKNLPRHKIVMRVTSDAPIGTVGYVVPTSLNESSGIVRNIGKSWSLTTTAYGDPDYAELFMQAGTRGFPITCTITVDGRVTEHRSTEGPYGQLICQG